MALNKKIRWGVIGAGRIAHTFCKDMAFCEHAELSAIAARSLQSAQNFADIYAVDKAYGAYQHLYDDPQIDAIYIATPHNFHFAQAKASLLAGKHVLVEKPITVSAQQCAELIALAKAQNCFLMEAMWSYFLPTIIKAKLWFDEGRIGNIVHIKADFGYPVAYVPGDRMYEPTLNGGCLLDMGIYPLALAQYFLCQQPISSSYSSHFASTGVEDDLIILADYSEARATLATSFRAKLQNSAYIIGDKGYIDIPNFWRADRCSLFAMDSKVDEFIDERKGSGFEFQIDAASEAIKLGKRETELMPHSLSLDLQKQMDSIRGAIENQRSLQ
ncbi:MAG: putative dehydrogenase [Paraglaciecola sp.]|jgi:predicted dehydrogenase